MVSKLIRALIAVGDLTERVEQLEQLTADLGDRMDRDEAKRSEWVGTVKRTLARINKAERNGEVEEQPQETGPTYGQLVRQAFRRS